MSEKQRVTLRGLVKDNVIYLTSHRTPPIGEIKIGDVKIFVKTLKDMKESVEDNINYKPRRK